MFKLAYFVGIFVAVGVFVSVGAITSERYIGNAVNKGYPGMCYYEETKTPIAVGETYKPTTECVEIYCRDDYVLHLRYCPRYMLGEGCVVTRDEKAQFPDCCPKIVCGAN